MKWEAHQDIELKALHATPGRLDVYFSRGDLHNYVVLAERAGNPAASVTNAYELYAEQICHQFNIDPNRTVFFELYVIPEVKGREIVREYTLDLCTPKLPALDYNSTDWRPAQNSMRDAVLKSLQDQCRLSDSYTISDRDLKRLHHNSA